MKWLLLVPLLLLESCEVESQSKEKSSNPAVDVELVLEHDGVKVYRFWNGGRYIYYTDARGSTQTRRDSS